MAPDVPETLDGAVLARARGLPGRGGRLYLLVLEGDSCAMRPLPREGAVLIGRAPEAELHVEDPAVSRQHARVVVLQGVARIFDLGSHNGVQVNGVPVQGDRPLQSGDVLSIGAVTMVFHCSEDRPPARPLLEFPGLRRRLSEELERVLHYERSVGVAAIELGRTAASESALLQAAGAELRSMDLVGQEGPGQLLIVLPELAPDEVEESAEALLERLVSVAPGSRVGLATAPRDGMDADSLIAAARAAALMAPPGGLRASGLDLHRLALGERTVVVADPGMVRIFELLKRLAGSTIPVLVHGETGTGKENAAWAIHHWSSRAAQRFVALNCAALPEHLVESELFGHERGAFSGAQGAKQGLLEVASGGTLFLDEVAELSPATQAKLLRALDHKHITRLGDTRERPVDLRIVAATHRVLREEVEAGRFRQDLFFRLSSAVVLVPPLRDRPRELPLLAQAFLAESCGRVGRPPMPISAGAMGVLGAHGWPGNVRELKNAMDFAAAVAAGPVLEPSHLTEYLGGKPAAAPLPAPSGPGPAAGPATFRPIAEELRELERRRMSEALRAAGGVQTHAASLIGMPIRTFTLKMKQYGLAPRR
jgi:DNA-binding NtrC family response regulator